MILLIRHCTPKINYGGCNYLEAKQRINEYNDTTDLAFEEIIPFKSYLDDLLKNKSCKIFSSSLPRALLTTKNIFSAEDNIIIIDDFKEFDLNIIPLPFFKFNFRT